MRIAYCPACSAQAHGVKTRIPLEHTCGLERGEINPNIETIPELQYRGPSSLFKACEYEAAGIKGPAEKHTCRKRRNKQ